MLRRSYSFYFVEMVNVLSRAIIKHFVVFVNKFIYTYHEGVKRFNYCLNVVYIWKFSEIILHHMLVNSAVIEFITVD